MKRTIVFSLTVAAMLGTAFRLDAAEPVKYAVLVGVKEYEHPRFKTLNFAENDVAELAQRLRAGGFQVTQLSDTPGAKVASLKPTRSNILRELNAVLKMATKKDMVLIALSGHGLQPFGSKENFFCPADARAQDLNTLIGMADLYEKLDRSAAKEKLVFIDACRDDPAAGKGITRLPLPPEGMGVLLSCSPGEQAFENKKVKHGVFFHFLLEGLDGKAKNEDGEVTFGRLAEYVQRKVCREVPGMIGEGAKQSPNLIMNIPGESPTLLKGVAGTTVVADNVLPNVRDLVGRWTNGSVTYELNQNGTLVLYSDAGQFQGRFSYVGNVLSVDHTGLGKSAGNISWADPEKKTTFRFVITETNVPGSKAGNTSDFMRTK